MLTLYATMAMRSAGGSACIDGRGLGGRHRLALPASPRQAAPLTVGQVDHRRRRGRLLRDHRRDLQTVRRPPVPPDPRSAGRLCARCCAGAATVGAQQRRCGRAPARWPTAAARSAAAPAVSCCTCRPVRDLQACGAPAAPQGRRHGPGPGAGQHQHQQRPRRAVPRRTARDDRGGCRPHRQRVRVQPCAGPRAGAGYPSSDVKRKLRTSVPFLRASEACTG